MINNFNNTYEISQIDGVITFKNKNTTIGFIRFNDKGEVEYIFVNPAFRKKGVAKKLLRLTKEKLGKKNISLVNLNLLVDKLDFDNEIYVKVRSTGKLLKANIDIHNSNTADVNLVNSEDGISPGQACVFYRKDNIGYKVLGGGWIRT